MLFISDVFNSHSFASKIGMKSRRITAEYVNQLIHETLDEYEDEDEDFDGLVHLIKDKETAAAVSLEVGYKTPAHHDGKWMYEDSDKLVLVNTLNSGELYYRLLEFEYVPE